MARSPRTGAAILRWWKVASADTPLPVLWDAICSYCPRDCRPRSPQHAPGRQDTLSSLPDVARPGERIRCRGMEGRRREDEMGCRYGLHPLGRIPIGSFSRPCPYTAIRLERLRQQCVANLRDGCIRPRASSTTHLQQRDSSPVLPRREERRLRSYFLEPGDWGAARGLRSLSGEDAGTTRHGGGLSCLD